MNREGLIDVHPLSDCFILMSLAVIPDLFMRTRSALQEQTLKSISCPECRLFLSGCQVYINIEISIAEDYATINVTT